MAKPKHIRLSDLHGLQRLAVDATVGVTDLVEAMHRTVTDTPFVVGKARGKRTSGVTGFVYKSVRGVTRAVGVGAGALFGMLAPVGSTSRSSDEREAVVAALNGVLGDHLAASGNPLAVAMAVRVAGNPIRIARDALAAAFPEPGHKVVVLVHGLCMSDLQWSREGHDHGAALARDLGYTPLYLHYNTGRHLSVNGRELDELMESLLREWPHAIDRLVMIGHSMGGLVARSACDHAQRAGRGWIRRLDSLVFLGTPHLGAPLERAGAWVDYLTQISPYSAPFARLGKLRSAGIKDLRYGQVGDADASPPLPGGVRCFAIAASRQRAPGTGTRMRGDGLVPVASALGRHRNASLDLGLPETHRWVGFDMGHLELLSRVDVYERVRRWVGGLKARPGSP